MQIISDFAEESVIALFILYLSYLISCQTRFVNRTII